MSANKSNPAIQYTSTEHCSSLTEDYLTGLRRLSIARSSIRATSGEPLDEAMPAEYRNMFDGKGIFYRIAERGVDHDIDPKAP